MQKRVSGSGEEQFLIYWVHFLVLDFLTGVRLISVGGVHRRCGPKKNLSESGIEKKKSWMSFQQDESKVGDGTTVAPWLAYLFQDAAVQGSIPGNPIFSVENFILLSLIS